MKGLNRIEFNNRSRESSWTNPSLSMSLSPVLCSRTILTYPGNLQLLYHRVANFNITVVALSIRDSCHHMCVKAVGPVIQTPEVRVVVPGRDRDGALCNVA